MVKLTTGELLDSKKRVMGKTRWQRFISNNGTFKDTDIIYREVYFINVLWVVMICNSLYFVFINHFISYLQIGVIMNIVVVGSTLGMMVYFHKTSNYNIASIGTVLIIISILINLFYYYGSSDYALVWLFVLPPITYSLLGKKKTRFMVIPFLGYVFLLIYLNYYAWEKSGFSFTAIQNIFGALIGVILTINYFEKSRSEALVKLEERNIQLEVISTTDSLTGLFNRAKIGVIIENEIARALRGGHSFSIVMIDIDHFKTINDSFGHLIGDQHLLIVSNILSSFCRQLDFICRWGGEEFLIVCPETDASGVKSLAYKLLKAIQEYPFEQDKAITFSIGVSTYQVNDTEDSLIKRADDALYLAKRNGRNRIESLETINEIFD